MALKHKSSKDKIRPNITFREARASHVCPKNGVKIECAYFPGHNKVNREFIARLKSNGNRHRCSTLYLPGKVYGLLINYHIHLFTVTSAT
uniref:Uncharacterized protein n=1 Tax=Anopheles minimus TaxID=112268 RepID=A0A182W4W4_9DIPT